ncbi:T9SS type A sorting domain-containing protein [Flavobacterium sp. SM15]|uniref:DUF7619 domain-containing protein n=1 Tax=Flavobacterium sp. SM15 TaxID=2908005 RepID=UPI001EDAFA9B|nr:T9SS type A sorting domain-containing protein [Flavobacterium sp. SM15]MCG2611311.1 T9SS type A sorting domain-containing protein [Flavobacterium sp. SM15]
MKKLFLLLLLVCGFAHAQIVNIPDANFKTALVNSNCVDINNDQYGDLDADANNNGEIELSEALAVQNLIVFGSNISSLEGIQSFANLVVLSAGNNQIASFDGTGLINLKSLRLYNNQLTGLDVSNLPLLENLQCFENNLNSLNVLGLTHLKLLDFNSCQLTNISLSGLSSLEDLRCYSNQLSALDLNGLIGLKHLYCMGNQLTTLDFTGLLNLQDVNCRDNQLNQLDFSGNPLFEDLSCANNSLYYINIKNGRTHWNPDNDWSFNPNLISVCIDESERSMIEWVISNSTAINVDSVISNYCSFVPGGNYNTITGNVIFDADNNGCDASDLPQPFIKMEIANPALLDATYTNMGGNYAFYTSYVPSLFYIVRPDIENASFFNFSPASATITFPDDNNNVATQNFCITANGVHPDLEIVVLPVIPARPGLNATYKIVFKNKGNQVMSQLYGVTFSFNQHLMNLISSSIPTSSQTPGTLTWDYSNLMPFESRSIDVVMHVNTPTDTNPVNAGDILQLTATVSPMLGDENVMDNTFQYSQTVVNSYDPNDKICLQGETESPTKIGDYLHYVINFENIGTDDAINVVVKDVIDTTKFDEKSLQILDSSHPVTAKISGNVAEFIFESINLTRGGHGNILLKVKTRDNLVVGDVVTNKADIFFDYNAPIQTNMAATRFESLGIVDTVVDNLISIYPNPTNDVIQVKSESTIQSIQLFDAQGRLLQTRISEKQSETIDLNSKASGVYFVKITTEKGGKIEKVIKK